MLAFEPTSETELDVDPLAYELAAAVYIGAAPVDRTEGNITGLPPLMPCAVLGLGDTEEAKGVPEGDVEVRFEGLSLPSH